MMTGIIKIYLKGNMFLALAFNEFEAIDKKSSVPIKLHKIFKGKKLITFRF